MKNQERSKLLIAILLTIIFFIPNLILSLNHETPTSTVYPLPYPAISAITLGLSTLSAFLFAWRSNFHPFLKLLVLSSAAFFYNSTVIPGPSAAIIFALSAYAAFYPKRTRHKIIFFLFTISLISGLIFFGANSIRPHLIGISYPDIDFPAVLSQLISSYNFTIFGNHFPVLPLLYLVTLIYLLFKSPRLSLAFIVSSCIGLAIAFINYLSSDYIFGSTPLAVYLPIFFLWLSETEHRRPRFIRKRIINFFKNLELAKLLNGRISGSWLILAILALSIPKTISYANFDLSHSFSYRNSLMDFLNSLEPDANIISDTNLNLTLSELRQLSFSENATSLIGSDDFKSLTNHKSEHLYFIGSLSSCAKNSVPKTWEKIAVFSAPNPNINEPTLTLYKIKD